MKTTVEISDSLLRDVQIITRKEGLTLKAAIAEGLHDFVSKRKKAQKLFKLKDGSFPPADQVTHKTELPPWEELRAIIYEGRGG